MEERKNQSKEESQSLPGLLPYQSASQREEEEISSAISLFFPFSITL